MVEELTVRTDDRLLLECHGLFFFPAFVRTKTQKLDIPRQRHYDQLRNRRVSRLDALLRTPPLLLILPLTLRLFARPLLCAFLLCGDTRDDIRERVVDDANDLDLWRAVVMVNTRKRE